MHAVHQFVAGFAPGDAISHNALALRAVFRSWGRASEIFCDRAHVSPLLARETQDAARARRLVGRDDAVLLHLSIGADINDIFGELACRKAILYHNITPPGFFHRIQERIASDLARGRAQARALHKAAQVVMAVSRYNADELKAMGYAEVQVLPLLLDFSLLRAAPEGGTLRRMRDGKLNILFVGRCAPNKKIEDALCAFYYFQKFIEPRARFVHVGSYAGLEHYQLLLRSVARRLGLDNVLFTGAVPQAELNAYYASARVFLCLSDHEGFCIPLIESMLHDVPVLAYAAGAVPETLAGAGVLITKKRWDLIAEMLGRLAHDRELRAAVLAGQRARLAAYTGQDLEGQLRDCLAPLLN
jgi:L-malate glycosyltransferase